MIIRKIIFVGCIAFLSACSTSHSESTNNSETTNAVAEAGETTASNSNGDLRCKNVTVTGSRFPVRRCTTAAQRARELDDAKKVLNDARNNVGAQN
ncbi:hypothetical protein [uncultured Paraglaciecola sp.]|uniref:hypothetical protein n=1 Tax=uncultured Paraglaciecola sp. TaxID=1765024 RepID=UPI0030D79589|tara:strand:- start:1626 stop:1913 length:288 start_codon:yes stop_codon:yes gene_type:complete